MIHITYAKELDFLLPYVKREDNTLIGDKQLILFLLATEISIYWSRAGVAAVTGSDVSINSVFALESIYKEVLTK